MIPRIAEGSWVIKQSVGTTPVIMGRKLKTSYHVTPKYVEVAVDVGSSSTAQYVTGMVSGQGSMCGAGPGLQSRRSLCRWGAHRTNSPHPTGRTQPCVPRLLQGPWSQQVGPLAVLSHSTV
jgi:hypothetical protein